MDRRPSEVNIILLVVLFATPGCLLGVGATLLLMLAYFG